MGLRARSSNRPAEELLGPTRKESSPDFFYCNEGNPLEENLNRVLIGVGRISNIARQAYFGNKPPKFPDGILSDLVPLHNPRLREPRLSSSVPRVPAGRSRHGEYHLPHPRRHDARFFLRGEHVSDDTAVVLWSGCCNPFRPSRTKIRFLATGNATWLAERSAVGGLAESCVRFQGLAACCNSWALSWARRFTPPSALAPYSKGRECLGIPARGP